VPIYVYSNRETGAVTEVLAHSYEPEKYRPGPEWDLQIQTSLVIFGDFIIGDDDFSRRWHLNGKAGQYGGKPNRTQNHTNVNPMLRKWGKKGRPLELNPDIDTTKSWDASKGTPAGVDPETTAPVELRSSEAKGTSVRDV
jgi:hypothetical protein